MFTNFYSKNTISCYVEIKVIEIKFLEFKILLNNVFGCLKFFNSLKV